MKEFVRWPVSCGAAGFEWGFTALPKLGEDGASYSYTFFEQMFIPKGAKEIDLAKQFMAYMYSDEAAEIIYEKSGAVQPILGASELMTDDDPNKLFYEVYDRGAKAAMGGFAVSDCSPETKIGSPTAAIFSSYPSFKAPIKTSAACWPVSLASI